MHSNLLSRFQLFFPTCSLSVFFFLSSSSRPGPASMMQSENMLVQYMAQRSMYNVLGTLGTNRMILRIKFGVPRENGVFKCQYIACEEDRHRANMMAELVQVRDG